MYCHILYADSLPSGTDNKTMTSETMTPHSSVSTMATVNKTLTINPDCYVQILIEYVRHAINLDGSVKFDFCDEHGRLIKIYTLKECDYATKVFKHKMTYIIVIYEKNHLGKICKLEPYVHKTCKMATDICTRLSRNLNRGRSSQSQKRKSSDSGIADGDLSMSLSSYDIDMSSVKTLSNKSIRSHTQHKERNYK